LCDEGKITAHDRVVGEVLARCLSGGDAESGQALPEARLYQLEREAFLELAALPATQARIRHTLSTGKPLRN